MKFTAEEHGRIAVTELSPTLTKSSSQRPPLQQQTFLRQNWQPMAMQQQTGVKLQQQPEDAQAELRQRQQMQQQLQM